MKAAVIQMTSTPDREKNLREIRKFFFEATSQGARFVAFPENSTLFASKRAEFFEGAEDLDGVSLQSFQEFCAESGAWCHTGSMPFKIPGKKNKVTNTSFIISPDGEIAARYDKIHLFDASLSSDRGYRESDTVQAGRKVVSTCTPFGRAGLAICYDLRFPELFRRYAAEDLAMIFIPAAFTVPTGKLHWDVLTRARAIENQVFVLAPAQVGQNYPGRVTYGHSRIIDPWGNVIAERKMGAGVLIADLDFKVLEKFRREVPALRNRKLR